eukprot:16439168-Heterocapsa_arctica.AAC.1
MTWAGQGRLESLHPYPGAGIPYLNQVASLLAVALYCHGDCGHQLIIVDLARATAWVHSSACAGQLQCGWLGSGNTLGIVPSLPAASVTPPHRLLPASHSSICHNLVHSCLHVAVRGQGGSTSQAAQASE